MDIARVRGRGRVTIPQAIREEYDLIAGTSLEFVVLGPSRFACRVVEDARSAADPAEPPSAGERALLQEVRGAE